MELEPEQLIFSAANPDLGEAREALACEFAGEGLSLGVNPDYLADFLGAAGTEAPQQVAALARTAAQLPEDAGTPVGVVYPRFRFFDRRLSLIGALACAGAMLAINLFGSERRVELAMGRPPAAIGEWLHSLAKDLNPPSFGKLLSHAGDLMKVRGMKPRMRRGGPVREVSAAPDLERMPVLTCWPDDGGPFFSPDGNKIVWRRFAESGHTAEIWTMNADGSDWRQLTHEGNSSGADSPNRSSWAAAIILPSLTKHAALS